MAAVQNLAESRRQFKVLVIDDEPDLLDLLNLGLSREGFLVLLASNAAAGLRAAYQNQPDAVLLDVMMPDMDGFEVCRRLREMTDAPIIFVTAKGEADDVLQGFSVGADDYVVKPFAIAELMVRLQATLRRVADRSAEGANVVFPADDVMLDCDRHELVLGNRVIHLTPLEFKILRLLIRYKGKVLSIDAILAQVWGYEQVGNPDLVKQYVYRLRQKIERDPDEPRFLHTVWGEGYFFDPEAGS
ncbi:MAG: response regulator transcription factor [Anaerolineae bacterium]|nr:response regulator transcription factor [Anaerolineae bacterium]